jgi:hypothetical protein
MVKIECVYWKDKIGGEIAKLETEAFSYGFTVGPHGEWEMVIANEDKEVKKSEPVNIKIHEIKVPPKSIVLPCPIMRHALGVVSSLAAAGKPMPVEERRILDEIIFQPICDGVVHKGELLCVVNVLYASIERRLARGAAEKWLMERLRF